MSIIVIYNLGLAYHLKSIRERAEFSQASSSSAAPMDMSCSTSFLTSLQKAQVLYSMASRHLTHLPSWKFKLALLNNLGQVYSERNLGDNARPCFEAVCRHIAKIAYQCSRSRALIPFSSDGNGHNISDDMGTEKLLQALMMAALMKLLAKPHAGVAWWRAMSSSGTWWSPDFYPMRCSIFSFISQPVSLSFRFRQVPKWTESRSAMSRSRTAEDVRENVHSKRLLTKICVSSSSLVFMFLSSDSSHSDHCGGSLKHNSASRVPLNLPPAFAM